MFRRPLQLSNGPLLHQLIERPDFKPSEPTLDLFFNMVDKIGVYLGRPEVRTQLLAMIVVVVAAALFSTALFRWVGRPLSARIQRLSRPILRQSVEFVYRLGAAIAFPVLGFVFLRLTRDALVVQGRLDGLLAQFGWLLSTILIFQVIVTLLYAVFDDTTVRRYHFRLLIPLLVVLVLGQILSTLVDLRSLANIVLTTIFGSPVTVRALFLATVGLYFWTDATNSFMDLVYQLVTRRTRVDPGSAKATLTLLRYFLIILGVGYAIGQFRFDATTLAAITGGLSVGIGFGLREILSNFISGIILLFERSLQPGDVIEINNEMSVVRNLSVRATTVRTLDNVEMVIPNQTFFTSTFKTFTGTNKTVRVPILLRTDCNIEPLRVVEVLKETALSHPDVLKDREPSVFILEYGDNVASFQLNVWLDDPLYIPRVKSEVKLLVWKALAEHNIALPFPEVELHFPKQVSLQTVVLGGGAAG